LSIKDGGDGQLLANCFAGCTQAAIFAALFRRGLWVPPEPKPEEAAPGKPEELEDGGFSGEAEETEGEAPEDPAEAATKAAAEERAKKLAAARAKFQKGWEAFDAKSALHATVDAYCDWLASPA
jgi:hypothetical protein